MFNNFVMGLVLIFVHLTSRPASTSSRTLYYATPTHMIDKLIVIDFLEKN
jgi:hypothetical protein